MGSGNSAMKFAPLYVLLWAAPNLVAAQSEVICPEGKSKTTKSLGLDEYIDYKTQDGAPGTDYTNGVNCNVLFKRKKGSDCELKFNCTHFDLKSAKPAPKCQDKIIISKKKYCQTTGPDVTVSGSKLKVAFKTNKKGTATGAVCTAYCVPPPPPPETSPGPATTAAPPSGKCQCGIKKSSRIVGGTETEVNEYPWIAIWADASGEQQGGCGSTLISNRWVLTASHCFFNPETKQRTAFPSNTAVVLGVHDRLSTIDTLRKKVSITDMFLHPQFDMQSSVVSNDIALMKLGEDVDLSVYSPACLPASGTDFTGRNAWVYGWGATQEGGFLTDKLREVQVQIVSDSVCSSALEGLSTITQDMLCAGGVEGKDSCGGDSGGPLTVEEAGKHVLVGDVSFGIGCARDGLYGVYGEVAFFRSWIDSTIAENGGGEFCE